MLYFHQTNFQTYGFMWESKCIFLFLKEKTEICDKYSFCEIPLKRPSYQKSNTT